MNELETPCRWCYRDCRNRPCRTSARVVGKVVEFCSPSCFLDWEERYKADWARAIIAEAQRQLIETAPELYEF